MSDSFLDISFHQNMQLNNTKLTKRGIGILLNDDSLFRHDHRIAPMDTALAIMHQTTTHQPYYWDQSYNQSNNCTDCPTTTSQPTSNETTPRDLVMLIILAVLIIFINGLITLSFLLVKKLRHRPANIMICRYVYTLRIFWALLAN